MYLFIYCCARSSLLCVGFLYLQGAGTTLVVVCGLLIVEASLVAEHGALGHMGFSSCSSRAPEYRLSSRGTQA